MASYDPYENIDVYYYENVSEELQNESYDELLSGCEGGYGSITVTNWKWQEGDCEELKDCVLLAETSSDNGYWNPKDKKWIWESEM